MRLFLSRVRQFGSDTVKHVTDITSVVRTTAVFRLPYQFLRAFILSCKIGHSMLVSSYDKACRLLN